MDQAEAMVAAATLLLAMGATFIPWRGGWEARVVVYVVNLSLVESAGVAAWLWAAHGWNDPTPLGALQWACVFVAFLLVNEAGLWLLKDELMRDVRHARRVLEGDKAEWKQERDKLIEAACEPVRRDRDTARAAESEAKRAASKARWDATLREIDCRELRREAQAYVDLLKQRSIDRPQTDADIAAISTRAGNDVDAARALYIRDNPEPK